jgi:hypothetical protein
VRYLRACDRARGHTPRMVLMAAFGAAVLALVCWAALRETAPELRGSWFRETHGGPASPVKNHVIPQSPSGRHVGGSSDRDPDAAPQRPLAGAVTAQADGLHNSTFADADTEEALAAVAALWSVLAQDRQ